MNFLTFANVLWQGSAHSGPAMTPVEVLVAIHGIVPEKDGIALKKVCFCRSKLLLQPMVSLQPFPLLETKVKCIQLESFSIWLTDAPFFQ